jgi:hypothetical protein
MGKSVDIRAIGQWPVGNDSEKTMDSPTVICVLRKIWHPCLRGFTEHENMATPADADMGLSNVFQSLGLILKILAFV